VDWIPLTREEFSGGLSWPFGFHKSVEFNQLNDYQLLKYCALQSWSYYHISLV